jgi:hypothetical protein
VHKDTYGLTVQMEQTEVPYPFPTTTKNMLRLVGTSDDITSAINAFRPSYHEDFANVQRVARPYLNGDPTPENSTALAVALATALCHWSACMRRSPRLHSIQHISDGLADKQMHTRLAELGRHDLEAFNLDSDNSRILRTSSPVQDVRAFDIGLIALLNNLAELLFLSCTRATYPMKALLLITGLMPAFDSQVTDGLKRAGKTGFNNPHHLPTNTKYAGDRRICELPFYLGNCWSLHREDFQKGIEKSLRKELKAAPGRVFDILLFMQADPSRKLILAV